MARKTEKIDGQGRVRCCAFVFSVLIAAVLVVSFTGSLRSSPHEPSLLDSKINPNTANIDSLVRLPGIGPARATAIIEYRNKADIKIPAFKNADDLKSIKGIGPKTVENIGQYLYFDDIEN